MQHHWVFARDGSLTAMETNGRWWADCSVPLLAGRALLKTLQATSTGSCLLAPANAGLVIAARERIGRCTPLFVVQPDLDIARMIFSCHDFSADIARHRLWMVCGPNWAGQMRELFAQYAGLATPVQFIRTKLTPETFITPIVQEAQAVFSSVLSDRSAQIEQLRETTHVTTNVRNILLIGGSEFRLWDDGATVLHEQLSNAIEGVAGSISRFDTDEPLVGSPIALLEAACDCGSVVSANLCRPDCNNLVSLDIPWITWMTRAGAPPFETAGPKDGLILADAAWLKIARRAGWPDDRMCVAPYPGSDEVCRTACQNRGLAILTDTQKIEIPASIKQFSSHRLLWELIEEELAANPLAVQNIDDYLTNRSGQLNIDQDALDRRIFTGQLILPAYVQGLARMLITAGVKLTMWGEGWDELDEFKSAARGRLADRHELRQAVAQSTALVYCWPERSAHPIDAVGKTVVHRDGNDAAKFIRDAKRAINAHSPISTATDPTLADVIIEMLKKTR